MVITNKERDERTNKNSICSVCGKDLGKKSGVSCEKHINSKNLSAFRFEWESE